MCSFYLLLYIKGVNSLNKKTLRSFEINEDVYNELAERRTIELLGLTDKEVTYAKAFETTKAVELMNIKKNIESRE